MFQFRTGLFFYNRSFDVWNTDPGKAGVGYISQRLDREPDIQTALPAAYMNLGPSLCSQIDDHLKAFVQERQRRYAARQQTGQFFGDVFTGQSNLFFA